MPRLLLALLRRSWGAYAFPLFLILEAVSVTSRERIWAIEWQWATSWANGILVLLGPLTAAVAAAETAHLRRNGGSLLRRAGNRELAMIHAARILAVAAWAIAAHAAGLAATWLIVVARHGELGQLEWRLVPPAFVLLVAASAAGTAAGWLVPRLITAPVIAIVGYLLPAVQLLGSQYFLIGGATGPLVGLEYRPVVLLAQSLFWFACIAFTTAVMMRRSLAAAMAIGVAMVAVAGSGAWLDRLPETLRARPVTSFACDSQTPQVCVPAEYREVLDAVARSAGPTAAALRSSLGDLRVTRLAAFAPPPLPAGWVAVPTWLEAPYTDDYNVAVAIVTAASGCTVGPTAGVDREIATIVPAAAPALQGYATRTGLPLLTRAEAKARFEALRAECSR